MLGPSRSVRYEAGDAEACCDEPEFNFEPKIDVQCEFEEPETPIPQWLATIHDYRLGYDKLELI